LICICYTLSASPVRGENRQNGDFINAFESVSQNASQVTRHARPTARMHVAGAKGIRYSILNLYRIANLFCRTFEGKSESHCARIPSCR